MKKDHPASESAFFNPRIFATFILCSVGALLAMFSLASTPSSGTLSEANPVLTYDAGPFFQPNQSPLGLGQLDSGPRCNNTSFPCDNFTLTVNVPSDYQTTHPNASLKVTLYWTDTGSGQSDYDLYIYKGIVGDLSGSQQADYQAASGANPEVASVTPVVGGTSQYSLKIVPYTPTGETVHVRIELLTGSGSGGGFPGFGGPDPTTPGVPRYQNFYAPSGSSAEPSNGEFNIGFNPATGRIMTMNTGPIWRLTPPERLSPAQPECCEALWEDKTALSTLFGLDPILWTDQKSGRTFASNSTVGTNGVYAFSDNDGDLWNPVSAAPPNASSDHETIGSGPYPTTLAALRNAVNKSEAVYYCAQTYPVGAAACQRSDTLGSSYGPSTLPYNGNTTQCAGIHGHVKVGPDGTVYLPVRDCNGNAGVSVSGDGGITWTEHIVPNSKTQTHGSDPSIAVGANNTVYFFYVADQTTNPNPSEGHIHVQISSDHGATWTKNTDLGISHGVKNAVFPEAVAGDNLRAACGFLGTDRAGDYEGASFEGIWYLFIATTYDGGNTWNVVNATPNDPVQGAGGIWQGGGSNQNRNLLDFNEVTMDDKGRVLFGYSDGCVSVGCISGAAVTDYVAFMRVARQSGGKGLLSAFDTAEPAAPKPPCLFGVRDVAASHLTWNAPDNGGSNITNYQIWRGTASGGETKIGDSGTANKFDDTSADPSVAHYYYYVKATNSSGTGPQSNEVNLTVSSTPPPSTSYSCSGTNVVTDGAGDALNPAPGGAGPTSQADITAISFSAGSPATTITTKMTLDNLTSTPSPGTTFTTYYVVWTSTDGKTYATEVDVSPGPVIAYGWGEFDPANNQITGYNGTTGTFNPGLNGTITVNVPVSGVGSPTIPITDVNGTPAVRNTYGLTFGGEGIVGSGLVFTKSMDRAPNINYGQSWAVCPPPNAAPTAALTASPSSGTAPLAVNFDGSGSHDPDAGDSIASYTFNFGDNSPAVTQVGPTISHTYNTAGNYAATLFVKDSHGEPSTNAAQVLISVAAPQPDLIVSTVTDSNNQARQGDKVTFTATITNIGQQSAGPSKTEFLLDGSKVLGLIDTPAIGAGQSVQVSVNWLTASAKKGQHTIKTTADRTGLVTESNEGNNTKIITVSLQGNKT